MPKNLKKNLQTVNREIKALSKKVDRMIVTVGKLENPKAVKAKPVKKTVAKAKPVKKVAAKKAPVKEVAAKNPAAKKPKAKPTKAKAVKKTPAKKVAPKKATSKKVAPATAADTVLAIIKRYKKGVDVSTLMGKTGFNRRKIYDNAKVLKKRGKIKSVGTGVYLKA